MGIAPSHVDDDPETTTTTTTGESKTNDNKSTINGIVLPSLGEVPVELECVICAEVVLRLFGGVVFSVYFLYLFLFFRVF